MEVSKRGSMILFRHIKDLGLEKLGIKLSSKQLADVLGLYPTDMTHWKQGKRLLRDVSQYRKLAQLVRVDVDRLIDIATETDLEMVDRKSILSADIVLDRAKEKQRRERGVYGKQG